LRLNCSGLFIEMGVCFDGFAGLWLSVGRLDRHGAKGRLAMTSK